MMHPAVLSRLEVEILESKLSNLVLDIGCDVDTGEDMPGYYPEHVVHELLDIIREHTGVRPK